MEIQNTKYDKHVIGDNVALSFDRFYSDIDTLKQDCPKPFYYPIPVSSESAQPIWAEPVRYDLTTRIPSIPEIEEKLFPRLAPVSPAGPVTKIKNAEYNIVETLKPIIEKEYNKTISEAKVQNVASCNDDYLLHIDAFNTLHDDWFFAFVDEMVDEPEAKNVINRENWIERNEKLKVLREKNSIVSKQELQELWNYNDISSKAIITPELVFDWIRKKSKRIKLQNHPCRPQWGDEDTFLCITVLHANDKEVPDLEFWKHKPFISTSDIDDEQNNLYSMKKEYIENNIFIPQLIYYETWHYSDHYDKLQNGSFPPRQMPLSDQATDHQHANNDYDLVNHIPAIPNKCFLFPANYFHKMSFDHNWYWTEQMITQILLLK